MIPRLLLVVLALAACAPAARADEGRRAIVVLDRGKAAKESSTALGDRAIRLVAALQRKGGDVLLLAAGADAKGKALFTAPQPTLAGITALDKKDAFAFAGETDPRPVLDMILTAEVDERPVDVYLLGPFGAARDDATVPAWNKKAPAESRVFPLALTPDAYATLAMVRGLQTTGWLVLSFDKPVAKTEPYTALDPSANGVMLAARVRVGAEALHVGAAGVPPPLLEARTDLESDTVTPEFIEGLSLFGIGRTLRDGRTATIRFKALAPEHVHWLCDPPGPLTFAWDRVKPGARVLGPSGEAKPRFDATDATAAKPVSVALRLVRSRAGPAPAWRGPDLLPTGLTWVVGPEVRTSDALGESELRITFKAEPATPRDEQGVLELTAEGVPDTIRVPYAIRVAAGRAQLVLADARIEVPQSQPLRLRIEADGNTPAAIELRYEIQAGRALLPSVTTANGTVHTGDGPLPVNEDLELRFVLREGGYEHLPVASFVTVLPGAHAGVEFTGEARIGVGRRMPRFRVDDEPAVLRVENDTVVVDHPLLLHADPGDGPPAWILEMLRVQPRVARTAGGVETWEVVGAGEPGTWKVMPKGAWRGGETKIFDDGRAVERIWVEWDGGQFDEPIDVSVAIPARWGTKGYLFVGLAMLAFALGVGAFVMMRPPPLTGTLLYTVERMAGTVGRLDLSPVGRKPATIAADKHGRLELDIAGELVARLKPTRVGGMIEVRDAQGGWERRLLVDGLSLRAGVHALRYVSGQPSEKAATAAMEAVPDLLGPEYDIDSGRIDSLDASGDT